MRISQHFYWNDKARTITRDGEQPRPQDDLDAAIDVFEDRTTEWSLKPLKRLLEDVDEYGSSPGEYVVLSQIFSHIEAIERWRTGVKKKGNNGELFKASAARILKTKCSGTCGEKVFCKACRLWDYARNLLVHEGFTFSPTQVVRNIEGAVELHNGVMSINPCRLLKEVEDDFGFYTQQLRTADSAERKSFKELWDLRWEMS